MPFFNRSNNEDLILAIQSAGVFNGRNGFRKDKSGEKLAESEEYLPEHRTDAFDTPYIGAEKFPYHDMPSPCRAYRDDQLAIYVPTDIIFEPLTVRLLCNLL